MRGLLISTEYDTWIIAGSLAPPSHTLLSTRHLGKLRHCCPMSNWLLTPIRLQYQLRRVLFNSAFVISYQPEEDATGFHGNRVSRGPDVESISCESCHRRRRPREEGGRARAGASWQNPDSPNAHYPAGMIALAASRRHARFGGIIDGICRLTAAAYVSGEISRHFRLSRAAQPMRRWAGREVKPLRCTWRQIISSLFAYSFHSLSSPHLFFFSFIVISLPPFLTVYHPNNIVPSFYTFLSRCPL